MGAFLFYLFYGSTWLIAQLPIRIIFAFSDFLYVVIYRIIRYRRGVVRMNLNNSFPEKSFEEILEIEKGYYRHFCDIFMEDILLLHASPAWVQKRVHFKNLEVLENLYKQGKSVVLVTAHYCNWELLSLAANQTSHKSLGVYKPLSNKRFEVFINRARERFGAIAVPMNEAFRTMVSMHRKGELSVLCLIIDQTPQSAENRYWTTFLNQDTPVFLGVEKIAISMNQPVVFCLMRKVARMKYEATVEVLTENPRECAQYEITEKHVKTLEGLIRENPSYWLWSHRRWKKKRPLTEASHTPDQSKEKVLQEDLPNK